MTAADSLLDQPWWLSPSVALRPEPFGALVYHFGNRKLIFLKRPELVSVVRGLERHDDVRSALVEAGVPETQWPAYESVLRSRRGAHSGQQVIFATSEPAASVRAMLGGVPHQYMAFAGKMIRRIPQ